MTGEDIAIWYVLIGLAFSLRLSVAVMRVREAKGQEWTPEHTIVAMLFVIGWPVMLPFRTGSTSDNRKE